jgi:uncharacterized membrane protein
MQFKELKFSRTQLNWACLLSVIPGIVCLIAGGIFGFEHPILALILSVASLIFLIISVFLILIIIYSTIKNRRTTKATRDIFYCCKNSYSL